MTNSSNNIDVGELVANIVNHPNFRQTLTNILQSSLPLNTVISDSNTLAIASGSLVVLGLVGQTRVLAVLLAFRQDSKRPHENTTTGTKSDIKIRQLKERFCSVMMEMATIFYVIMTRSLVGKRR